MDERLSHILATAGAIHAGTHRELRERIRRAVARGELMRLLPGVYGADDSFLSRVAALRLWDPDAVLTGATAARVTWWPEFRDDSVSASTRRQMATYPGYDVHRWEIPADLILEVEGHRVVYPSLSVLQLIPRLGPTCIDEALRRRATSIAALHDALRSTPGRPGNPECLRHLRISRDEPWSHLERQAHQILRRAGFTGWRANHRLALPSGVVYLDIAFLRWRVAVEVDGFSYHSDPATFHSDRRRDVELQLAGWRVLRFTAETLPGMPEALRRILREAERRGA